MQLIYLGPRAVIRITGQGDHRRGESKDYPDDVAAWLLATSRRNRWEVADLSDSSDLSDPTDQTDQPEATPAPKPKRKRK